MTGLSRKQLDDSDAHWEPPTEQEAAKIRKLGRSAAKKRAAMTGELMTPMHEMHKHS